MSSQPCNSNYTVSINVSVTIHQFKDYPLGNNWPFRVKERGESEEYVVDYQILIQKPWFSNRDGLWLE